MTISIKHNFVSTKPDGTDATLIKASNWNESHSIAVNGPALVGNATSGAGSATEITLGTGLSFTGNVLNAADPALLVAETSARIAADSLLAPQATTYTKTETDARIQSVVGAAPAALDTLVEIATQLASDESAAATLTSAVSTKAPLASPTFTGTVSGITASMVGLANVNNTSDANKPVSTAQAAAIAVETSRAQTAEALLAPKASPTFTGTVSGITKTMVGLGNVDNTSDANKPVSTAQATAISSAVSNITPTSIGAATTAQGALAGTAVQPAAQATAIASAIASIPLATQTNNGLMSQADKYAIAQMPSVTFLQNVQHTRTLLIAHAGDSISYLTGNSTGDNFITQALARIYTGRVEYGDHLEFVYSGDFTLTNSADTVTLTYDNANAQKAFFESKLGVGKWIQFPTSGVPSDFVGIYGRITAFNTTARTVTLRSNSITRTYTINGNTLTVGSASGVNLKMTETVDRYNLAQGGWTSTEILTQIPYIQGWQVVPDILILNGGTNDGSYTNSAANIQAVSDAALAAGVKCVCLMPMTPKVSGSFSYNSAQLNQFLGAIHKQETYARNTPGVFFFNPGSVFQDATSSVYAPIGGTTGSISAVTADGLHPSVRGGEVAAQFFAPLLKIMSAQRYPKAIAQADVYDATNNPKANLIGRAGVFYSSGVLSNAGTLNGTNNAGIADGWQVNTQGTGPVITPSIVTSDFMAGGYKAQRFTLSGTTDSGGGLFQMVISFQDWSYAAFANSPRVDGEVCLRLNAPNLTKANFIVNFSNSVGGGGPAVNFGPSWYTNPCDSITQSNDWLFVTIPRPALTNSNTYGVNIYLQFAATPNTALSGYIDIAHCGAFFL